MTPSHSFWRIWGMRVVLFWGVETLCVLVRSLEAARAVRFLPPGTSTVHYLVAAMPTGDVAIAFALATGTLAAAAGVTYILERLLAARVPGRAAEWRDAHALHYAVALIAPQLLFFTILFNAHFFAPVLTPVGVLQNLAWLAAGGIMVLRLAVVFARRVEDARGPWPVWAATAVVLDVYCFGVLYLIEIGTGHAWDATGIIWKTLSLIPLAAAGFCVYQITKRRAVRRILAGVLLGALLGALITRDVYSALAARRPPLAVGPDAPDIILIVMDTTRSDALGSYGAVGPDGRSSPTPHIDLLARHGTRFTNAWSTSNWTVPAHASMFTGLHPVSHGAHWEHLYLSPAVPTLAEYLTGLGYDAVAFCENAWIGPVTGMDRGFQEFRLTGQENAAAGLSRKSQREPYMWEQVYRRYFHTKPEPVGTAAAAFADWYARRTVDRPVFAFINLLAPHTPYRPPPEWRGLYVTDPADITRSAELNQNIMKHIATGQVVTPRDWDILARLHAAEVAWLDSQVGRIADALRAKEQLNTTLLILVGDHGENLGEQEHPVSGDLLWGHSLSHTDNVVGVPLIVRYPDHVPRGHVSDDVVSVVDVMPTVLSLIGRAPPDGVIGRAVFGQTSPPKFAFAQTHRPMAALKVFADYPDFDGAPYDRRVWMLMNGSVFFARDSSGRRFLYDLIRDPAQQRNLAHRRRSDVAEWDAALDAFLAAQPEAADDGPAPRLDPGAVEALKALGYFH